MSSDMGSNTTTYPSHHHHYHHLHHHNLFFNKKTLREIDIPPRKLLGRRSSVAVATSPDHAFLMDSPKGGGENEGLLQKYLPYNNLDDDDDVDADVDPYCSDHFRMYEFKVRKCTRSRSHDWTDCPFAHPGEKARRRDPKRFRYTGTVCAEFRRGSCSRGDNCEFAHGVFECWLHPSRYRTEACKDGKNCKRKVCFFAHTPRQLRVLPASFNNNSHDGAGGTTSASSSPATSFEKNVRQHRKAAANHCCLYCAATATVAAASPTSTLIGMSQYLSPPMSPSHSLSPPLSPVKAHTGSYKSGGDHLHHRRNNFGFIPEFNPYKDALAQLMSSLEAMELNQSLSSPHSTSASSTAAAMNGGNLRWVDVNFLNNSGTDDDYQHQQQFILSPSTPIHPIPTKLMFTNNNINNHATFDQENYKDSGISGPDLGWVNDLLT